MVRKRYTAEQIIMYIRREEELQFLCILLSIIHK